MELLERNYRTLQAALHPDRFVNAAPVERLAALQRAGMLNEAYATLKSPLHRAGHVLALEGIATTVHRQQDLEPAFLLAQMELREDLEAVAGRQDLAGLAAFRTQVRGELAGIWQGFVGSIAAGEPQAGLPLFHKLQFLHKLLEEIAEVEDRLLD
jgi:molecular chaperone HscB